MRVQSEAPGLTVGCPIVRKACQCALSSYARSMLTAAFAGELFGPGQPLDAKKYFIIIPYLLGHGSSSKPSDGLKAKFPQYNYSDMVVSPNIDCCLRDWVSNTSDWSLVTQWGHECLVVGREIPGYMHVLVPMASQPTAMSSRNWMLRRMMLESIRRDPEYNNGNYTAQPHSMKLASVFFGIATAGGTLNYQKLAPTREQADKLVDARLASAMTADANDFLWQWGSSADYDAAPGLEKIEATVLAINSADDERNPPETGLITQAMKRVKNGKLYLILANDETSGHLTTGNAKFYKQELQKLLEEAPRRAM